MPSGVEYVRNLCKENKIPVSLLEKECGFSNGYLNPKKANKIPYERAIPIIAFMKIRNIPVDITKLLTVPISEDLYHDNTVISLFSGRGNNSFENVSDKTLELWKMIQNHSEQKPSNQNTLAAHSEVEEYEPTYEDIQSLIARNGKKLTLEQKRDIIKTLLSDEE